MSFHPGSFLLHITCALFFLASATEASTAGSRKTSICCKSIPLPTLIGANITSLTSAEVYNFSGVYRVPGSAAPSGNITGLSYCDVNVTYTHPGVNDSIQVEVWLPLEGWNGRFLATGGGGFSAGGGPFYVAGGVAAGFATATTDGGNLVPPTGAPPGPRAFSSPGHLDFGLFTDFSGRALHEMGVIGKQITASVYGTNAHHSYWAGCSTGGRQGHMMAQRYPEDFNGILADAPGIFWTPLMFMLEWTQRTVLIQEDYFPTTCELGAFINATIALCDPLDGVVDGIIGDPDTCPFDADSLVGRNITCNGENITLNQKTANIFRLIHNGFTSPSGKILWPGYNWGTVISTPPNSTELSLGDLWIQTYIEANPNLNTSTLTPVQLMDLWIESTVNLGGSIETSDPDLSPFRNYGGKLLTWHGLADAAIPPNSTLRYRSLVEGVFGGYEETNEFYRLFFAPGVAHCGWGYGPLPTDAMDKLVTWVEEGQAPTSLSGAYVTTNGTAATRPICLWPQVAKYVGRGDPNSATSYECSSSF